MQVVKSSRRTLAMAKVFKAINHLASSFLPRERGHGPTTAKLPVGRPRKRKPSAEAPPVPNIDRASEILPSLSDDVGHEAKRIQCQYTTKQKMHVVLSASQSSRIGHAVHVLITQISAPPNVGAL